jgi:hypothetical protein
VKQQTIYLNIFVPIFIFVCLMKKFYPDNDTNRVFLSCTLLKSGRGFYFKPDMESILVECMSIITWEHFIFRLPGHPAKRALEMIVSAINQFSPPGDRSMWRAKY